MRIGIISDTHDRDKVTAELITTLNKEKIDVLIHCGDLVSPFMFRAINKFNGPVHMVPGYQDIGSLLNLTRNDKEIGTLKNLTIHDEFGELKIDNKKIAFIHNDRLGYLLAKSGEYDIVFHGHDHTSNVSTVGKTLLVNPGEIMGWKNPPSYAIYDTKTNKVEIIKL